jgi:hypothetical protein
VTTEIEISGELEKAVSVGGERGAGKYFEKFKVASSRESVREAWA